MVKQNFAMILKAEPGGLTHSGADHRNSIVVTIRAAQNSIERKF